MIYVYWAKGSDLYKVGYTSRNDPESRRKEWETGCPFPLVFMGSVEGNRTDERRIHQRLKNEGKWIQEAAGKEWFRLNTNDIEKILGQVPITPEESLLDDLQHLSHKLIKKEVRKISRRKGVTGFAASILKEFL